MRYHTLVVHVPAAAGQDGPGRWWVVPADEVARMAAGRGRGQHGENPFESISLRLPTLARFEQPPARLAHAVRMAGAQARAARDVATEMERAHDELVALAAAQRERVTAISR